MKFVADHFAPPEIKAASGLKIILSDLIIKSEEIITEKVKAAKRKSCAGCRISWITRPNFVFGADDFEAQLHPPFFRLKRKS